jgi:hypothetical protein
MAAQPARASAARLAKAPVLVLSAVRSGSAFLRVMLSEHTQLRAPHELRLEDIDVRSGGDPTERGTQGFGLDTDGLRYLLWDRPMRHLLSRSVE